MIKLLFFLLLSLPAIIHLFVYSLAPKAKWWENLFVVLIVTGTYLVLAFNFYIEQRIGEIMLVISLCLIALFAYVGIRRVYQKWKMATAAKHEESSA